MISEKEISELKKTYRELEGKLGSIPATQRPTVVRLAMRLKELIADIELVREKDKSMWNPALVTRIKLAKKGMELYKDVNQFEKDVAAEFERGNVPVDAGKRFISIVKLLRASKMAEVKKESSYFDDLIALNERYEATAESIREAGRVLRREQARVRNTLDELAALEKDGVDEARVRRHEELLGCLSELEKARKEYLQSLLSEHVAQLLKDMEAHSLKDYYPAFPAKEGLAELERFFSDYPSFGKCDVGQLCEFFGYSEKKLSHVCPETTRFRRVVGENRGLFEAIRSLGQTGFMGVDEAMDFYAGRSESARKAVERIRQLENEKQADKEEYEKSVRLRKRREELSGYSKNGLEAELAEIARLLELLESERPQAESKGLLSTLGSIFKR